MMSVATKIIASVLLGGMSGQVLAQTTGAAVDEHTTITFTLLMAAVAASFTVGVIITGFRRNQSDHASRLENLERHVFGKPVKSRVKAQILDDDNGDA